MARIEIAQERCKGCLLCVIACPKKLMRLSDKINAKGYHPSECSDMSACIGCAFCAMMCPDSAITVEK